MSLCFLDAFVVSSQPFQYLLQYRLGGDFAVRGFGDDDALRTFNHVIRHNHVAAHGEAMHEVGIVREGHLLGINRPRAIHVDYLPVVRVSVGRPVLGIDEVRA